MSNNAGFCRGKKQEKCEGELEIRSDGIYRFSKGQGDIKISNYVDIVGLVYDLDERKHLSEVSFQTPQELKRMFIKRSQYRQYKKLLELVDDGVDVDDGNVFDVCRALVQKEKTLEETFVHRTIGYGIYKDKVIFKLWKGIGIESSYRGNLKIQPMGDWKKYDDMMETYVFPHVQLQFVMAVSLSAVLLGRLRNYLDLESVLVHLVGDSSSGKSTATKLAISIFASPDMQEETLISTYNATMNALPGLIKQIHGIPFALDELSTNSSNDFTKMVYNLCAGKEKARMNADSEMKPRETWSTVLISNGEKSIINNSKKNTGIHMRVFEISVPQWTVSAEHSEIISAIVKENYAHLGEMFAEAVYARSDDRLRRTVDSQRIKLLKELEKQKGRDEFSERRVKYYALILQAAIICKKSLQLNFDVNRLRDFIIQQEVKCMNVRNVNCEFMQVLKDYIAMNQSMFLSSETKGFTREISRQQDYYGLLVNNRNRNCKMVVLLPTIFDEIVKLYGHEDRNVIIKKLKEKGLLDHEKDRNTRSRLINGVKHDCYVILLND